jgi:hypothetical protein
MKIWNLIAATPSFKRRGWHNFKTQFFTRRRWEWKCKDFDLDETLAIRGYTPECRMNSCKCCNRVEKGEVLLVMIIGVMSFWQFLLCKRVRNWIWNVKNIDNFYFLLEKDDWVGDPLQTDLEPYTQKKNFCTIQHSQKIYQFILLIWFC